eukprot:snap_masked-scaffold1048_size67263-processed-gene-0.16 protein:Tk10020 transcript:snap_masked-scaffold1048_size67263-processed-gene-0.16-mRNA-1 annotation:"dna repair protein complementing xp-a cells-like protein"
MSRSLFALDEDENVEPPPPSPEADELFEDPDDDLLAVVESEAGPSSTSLTLSQKARMERNRMKALTLKQARLMARPYPEKKEAERNSVTGEKVVRVSEKKVIDSGAGFFIEEDESEPLDPTQFVQRPAPILEPDQPDCLECGKQFPDSFLLRSFDLTVCDGCKAMEKDGQHELMTKTDAKNTFLLKDFEIEQKEPVLKFIIRKNPHNPRWGDMKLFLRSQIEDRALEVWGTEEALAQEHELREEKKVKTKTKKFNKQIKALRMQVRGSLYEKDLSTHKHEFGDEQHDEEQDEYFQICSTCDFVKRYEKILKAPSLTLAAVLDLKQLSTKR